MPQSEMEALIQLQKETIESLRQLVDSQRHTIEQMTKSHEEQTAQLNQTIANLNETVEYLKKKLFASSSEKTKKEAFPGQMDLLNILVREYRCSGGTDTANPAAGNR